MNTKERRKSNHKEGIVNGDSYTNIVNTLPSGKMGRAGERDESGKANLI